MLYFRWLLLGFFFPGFLLAQTPVPAQQQEGAVLILGATAHLGNGATIPNAAIAFDKGKFTMVADATTIRIDRNKFTRIYDASGKHVYPGLIATDTQLGLVEIEAVRATLDQAEVGAYNPNARALIAYNTDSQITPTVRSNGVLLAQICPVGGVLSGTSSVVQLDAWNWEDAAIRVDEGQHLNWPSTRSWGGWESGSPEQKANDQYAKQLDAITDIFENAQAYAQLATVTPVNPRFEAMRPLFKQQQTLYIHANEAGQIRDAVYFAARMKLKMVLVGATDAWLETTLLKEKQVPVIIARTQRLPSREDEPVDLPYKTPALLHAAGVQFAFSEDGSWKQRNLAFQAGQAVGAGLPYEAAIAALTLQPARMLGIDQQYGSIETGKSATLLISDGDILDMRTNRINAAFIDGRAVDLDNKQKELSRKYQEKYDRNKQ